MSSNIALFVDAVSLWEGAQDYARTIGAEILKTDYQTLMSGVAQSLGGQIVVANAYLSEHPGHSVDRFERMLRAKGLETYVGQMTRTQSGRFARVSWAARIASDISDAVDRLGNGLEFGTVAVCSGSGEITPALEAARDVGLNTAVIGFKTRTSVNLFKAADEFYPVTDAAGYGIKALYEPASHG